jgi:hypothetical protein
MSETPKLIECSFTFEQDGNGNGTTSDLETLTIDCQAPFGIDNDDGCFYVLKTEGWSIDKIEELQVLIERINKIIKKNDV